MGGSIGYTSCLTSPFVIKFERFCSGGGSGACRFFRDFWFPVPVPPFDVSRLKSDVVDDVFREVGVGGDVGVLGGCGAARLFDRNIRGCGLVLRRNDDCVDSLREA